MNVEMNLDVDVDVDLGKDMEFFFKCQNIQYAIGLVTEKYNDARISPVLKRYEAVRNILDRYKTETMDAGMLKPKLVFFMPTSRYDQRIFSS